MKKRKRKNTSRRSRQVRRTQIDIKKEVRYISDLAQKYDPRIISLGPLVFFSTTTGDAWVLDVEDHLALCLVRDGEEQPHTIQETAADFSIGWEGNYQIDGDKFMFFGGLGQIKTTIGYPTKEIQKASGFSK